MGQVSQLMGSLPFRGSTLKADCFKTLNEPRVFRCLRDFFIANPNAPPLFATNKLFRSNEGTNEFHVNTMYKQGVVGFVHIEK